MDDKEFDPDVLMFLDPQPDNELEFKRTYIRKFFIRVKGMIHALDGNGVPDPMQAPRPLKQFARYLDNIPGGWAEHLDDIPIYKAIVCSVMDQPNCYNICRGLKYRIENRTKLNSEEAGKIAPFLDHLVDRVCRGKQSLVQHLVDMFALKLLDPYNFRPEQALVLFGVEGSGKTKWLELLFNKLFNHTAYLSSSYAGITGKFNKRLMGKVIVQLDDGGARMTPKIAETFKKLITEPTLEIEGKFKESITVPNHSMFVCTANDYDRVLISRTDRRFFVLDVDGSFACDRDYHGRVLDCIEKYPDLIVRWFLSNHSGITRLPSPPGTEGKRRAIQQSRSPAELWMIGEIENNKGHYYNPGGNRIYIRVSRLYAIAKEELGKSIDFRLKDLTDILKRVAVMQHGGDKNGQYYFPNPESFEAFEKYLGLKGGMYSDPSSEDEWSEEFPDPPPYTEAESVPPTGKPKGKIVGKIKH